MTNQEALFYLAQLVRDTVANLPPSIGLAVAEKAQAAIDQLKQGAVEDDKSD